MDQINLEIIVATVVTFISVLLILFLLTVKSENRTSNVLFAAYLSLTAIDASGVIFEYFASAPTNILLFRNLLTFLQLPLFYLYVLSVCYSDFRLKPIHLLHVIPLLIVNLVHFPDYYLVDTSGKVDYLQNQQNNANLQFNYILLHIQVAVYLVLIFLNLRKAKRLYLENYTGENIASYHWLTQLTIAISIFYAIALAKNLLKFTGDPIISDWLKMALYVFQLLSICWYLLKALNNPQLFRNVDSRLLLVSDMIAREHSSPQDVDHDRAHNKQLEMLRQHMIEEKPYLDASLTIALLSDQIGIPVRELSLLINHELGQHFFDFVNRYRIDEAKKILNDPSQNQTTVLEILYTVGFNSKSSFNTAFKKHTGLTPTSFRNSL